MNKKRLIHLLIGPVLLLLFATLLPDSIFTTFESRAAVGTVAWMAYWWVTAPVDYAVTAFLPIALNALLQMTDMAPVIRFLPIMLVLLVSNILFMIRDIKKTEELGGSKKYFIEQYKKFPKMGFEEKMSLALFVIATLLSFTRQLYQDYLPGLKPAYSFVICAILSFLITNKNGECLMIWKSVQTKIVWEMIYIFAGGLAAGTLIQKSGAAVSIPIVISIMQGRGRIRFRIIYRLCRGEFVLYASDVHSCDSGRIWPATEVYVKRRMEDDDSGDCTHDSALLSDAYVLAGI